MNNPYFIPICFAAAAHGALLLGFTRTTVVSKKPIVPTVLTEWVVRTIEDEPAVVAEVDAREPALKTLPDAPQPVRGPEPVVLDFGDGPTMEPPPLQPVATLDLRRILEEQGGQPGGKGIGPFVGRIVSGGDLDNTPRTRFQARRDGMNGEVVVGFVVDERGLVTNCQVVRSSNSIFEEATLRAVSRWQFEPGRRNGRVVKFRMTVPVVFNVSDGL